MKVLVVDDDPIFRRLARNMLEGSGYEVMEAGDGIEALKIQESNPADVCLLDIFMPRCDGLETIKKFRAKFPSLPLICISASLHPGDLDYTDVGVRFGAHERLRKPFEAEELLEVIQRVSKEA